MLDHFLSEYKLARALPHFFPFFHKQKVVGILSGKVEVMYHSGYAISTFHAPLPNYVEQAMLLRYVEA
jgi:hypothetical protein